MRCSVHALFAQDVQDLAGGREPFFVQSLQFGALQLIGTLICVCENKFQTFKLSSSNLTAAY